MKPTNIWDFACKHPFLFTFGLSTIVAATGNIILSVINNEKENNQDECKADSNEGSASV